MGDQIALRNWYWLVCFFDYLFSHSVDQSFESSAISIMTSDHKNLASPGFESSSKKDRMHDDHN